MSAPPAPKPEELQVAREEMPSGIHNAYVFDVFNTGSWSVVLGAPMLLYLQNLKATATVIAIAACLSPMLNILQIPAAHFVERIGYRRFVLSGWTTRSFLVVGMAVIAFLPDSIDRTTRIVLMLFFSFIYNAMRGISVCGMLPWFTHIVPEGRRGEFLARDQSAIALSSIVSLLFFSYLLAGALKWYSFGLVFLVSAISAFVSLFFLRRVPDVPVEKIVQNTSPLPWREMFFYPPFFRYIRYNIVTNLALGANGAFWVRYFRGFLHISNSNVLLISCVTNMALFAALVAITPVIDRAGNKLVLTLSGILFACHFACWGLIAAGVVPFNAVMFIVQVFTSGVANALWNLANVRYIMGVVPIMGRAHFLALYSVASNLTVGIVPLLWGPVMDYLENWQVKWGFWQWNNYSFFYFTLVLIMGFALTILQSLPEPHSMTWEEFMRELLVKTPSRALTRILGRLRIPGGG